MFERLAIFTAVGVAALCLVGGWLLALKSHSPEWVSRSGALIVCLEAIIATVEHRLKRKLAAVTSEVKSMNPYIIEEVERAEGRLFLIATVLAVVGEAIHGFGDLLFESMVSYIH